MQFRPLSSRQPSRFPLTRAIALGALLFAASVPPALAATPLTPQVLLGVPQPVAGKTFQVTVIVEAQADATPVPTGNVTVNFGDGTTPTVVTLSNSLVTAQHNFAAAGQFTITAAYGGDANFAAATATQSGVILGAAPAAVTLNLYGDSITYGTGATTPADDYAELLTSMESWTMNNQGVPSYRAVDACGVIYGATVTNSSYSTLLIGQNDLPHVIDGAAYVTEYTQAVLACAAWLAIPASLPNGANPRLNAQSSHNTTTGAWTNSDLYTAIGRKSTAANATLSGTFAGNVLYAGLSSTLTTDYTISIAVDGKPLGSFAPQLAYAGYAYSYGPYGVRLSVGGSATASHTVTFTCVTPGSSGCYVDWFGGNGYGSAQSAPYLWLATPYQTTQPGYTKAQFALMDGPDRTIAADLASDGLAVTLADTANYFAGPTIPQCIASDSVHPVDCGHALLAATFAGAMDNLLPYAARVQLSTSGLHNFGYVAQGLTTKYGVQVSNETGEAYPFQLQLSGSPELTQANNCGVSVAAGSSCEILFIFSPTTGETGWATSNWSLANTSNAAVLAQNGGELEGEAFASTALTLNATAHNFGSIAVGGNSSTGNPAGLFGLVVVNPNSSPFTGTLTWGGATSQFAVTNGCALPLAAFSNCVASVAFAPTQTGLQTMTLTITPNAGEQVTPGNVVTFSGTGK